MKKNPIKSRQIVWAILSIVLIGIACSKSPQFNANFIPTADFKEQASTMLSWNKGYKSILLPMIGIIAKHDHVTIFYNEKNNRKSDIDIAIQ